MKSERELQLDLADHLRKCGYLTYTEIEIKGGRSGRADIVALKPSYANKDVRIYEVKNNRNVFKADHKYEKYLDVCHRMYIACPQGLIKKEELPPKIGLIVRGENGWHVIKSPQRNYPKDFNIDFVLSLLYRGYEETKESRVLRDRILMKDNVTIKEQAYYIGFEIGRRLDRDRETQVEEWVSKFIDMLKKYIPINEDDLYGGLPSIWRLEKILSSVSGTMKEANNIKLIGEYLSNLDLDEEKCNYPRYSLETLRNNALRNIV